MRREPNSTRATAGRPVAIPRRETADAEEEPFDVVCLRSGVTFSVPPGRSILCVAQEHGIEVPAWCVEGICGTCETEVRDGLPDHRDSLLTEEEREISKTMVICVSRCRRGPLVLEL
jgi:ferredoxin